MIIVMDFRGQAYLDSTPNAKSFIFNAYFPHFRKLRTTPRVGSRSSNRARQSQPIRAECSSNGSVAGGCESIEGGVYSFYPGTSALAIEGQEQLSISDRALLRKYGLSGQQQETIREPDAHHGTIPVVQRVDGHPPQGDLNLYDRMLATEVFRFWECIHVFRLFFIVFGSSFFASS